MDKTSGKTPADRLRSIKKKGRKDFEALSSLADKRYYIDRLAKFVDELMEQIDDERRENKYEDEAAIESDGEQSDEQFNPSGSDTEEVRAEQLELKETEAYTTAKSKLSAEVSCSESSEIIEATKEDFSSPDKVWGGMSHMHNAFEFQLRQFGGMRQEGILLSLASFGPQTNQVFPPR